MLNLEHMPHHWRIVSKFCGVALMSCSDMHASNSFSEDFVLGCEPKITTLKVSSELKVLKTMAAALLAAFVPSLPCMVPDSIMMITFLGADAAATYQGRNLGSYSSHFSVLSPGKMPTNPLAFAVDKDKKRYLDIPK